MANATFTSMDVSTKEEWLNIGAETAKNQPRVAEGILNMLRGMDTIIDGFVTDQLTHALQTATMAERARENIFKQMARTQKVGKRLAGDRVDA